MLYITIAFFLALIPFFTRTGIGDGVRTPKEIASIFGLLSIIAVSSWYKKEPFKNKCFWLLWIWLFAVTAFNWKHNLPIPVSTGIMMTPATLLAWKGLFYISIAFTAMMSIATAVDRPFNISFKSIRVTIDEHFDLKAIATALSWCVIVMGIYSIIQAVGLDNFFRVMSSDGIVASCNTDPKYSFTHRIVGTIGNPSIFGSWVAMVIPFTLYLKNKTGIAAFILGIVSLALSQGATAIAAAIICTAFYLSFAYGRKFIIPALIIITLSGAICLLPAPKQYIKGQIRDRAGFFNPTGRIDIHKETWKFIKERPLIGHGLGSFEPLVGVNPQIVERMSWQNWRELHDEYGQVWFTLGLTGLVLFIAMIISFTVRFLQNINDASITLASCMIGFLVLCITLFPMRVAPTSFYAPVLAGLLLKVTRRN